MAPGEDRGTIIETGSERQSWMTLAAVGSGLVLYALTSTTIGVALPYITTDFNTTITSISWVSTIFFIVHAVLMPVMGRAGDLYGRKKVFIFGISVFTAMSVFCALTWNTGSLIAGRGIMAIGTAALPPMALAYVYSAFPAARRALAIGVLAGVLGIAPTAGFLLGGALIDAGNTVGWLQWRVIFWINLPLAAVIIPVALRVLRESEPSPEGRDFDIPGAMLLVGGLAGLMLALNKGASWGWTSNRVLGSFAAMALLLLLFVVRERSCHRPLIDLRLFRYRSLVTANIAGFLITGGLFGSMLILPFYFQSVLDLSAFWIGLSSAPVAVTYALLSPVGGALTARLGGRTTLIAGLLVAGSGYLLVSQVLSFDKPQTEAALIVAAAVGLVGMGIGMTAAPIDNTALHGVPSHKRGLAASLPNMSRFIGGSFAIAVMTAVLSWRLTERLVGAGIPLEEARAFAGTSAEPLNATYKEAATQAYHDVFLFTLTFIAVGLVAAAFMPQVRKGK